MLVIRGGIKYMKNKILLITGKVLNVLIVIGTIIFGIINFENITYGSRYGLITEPSKSLHARYQYWLEDKYGRQEGVLIWRKIRDTTVWIIEHHINLISLILIVTMMVFSMRLDEKANNKVNGKLLIY